MALAHGVLWLQLLQTSYGGTSATHHGAAIATVNALPSVIFPLLSRQVPWSLHVPSSFCEVVTAPLCQSLVVRLCREGDAGVHATCLVPLMLGAYRLRALDCELGRLA